jgi:hypothetical protein
MIKKFNIQIPLSFEDSFKLLCKSGGNITSWKTSKADSKEGYIEWKQSLFSLTGSATIIAQLKQTEKEETSVDIVVQKPVQFIDPLGICDRVFSKLDKAWRKTLNN